jgi:glycosyltransferase involved in cell wall biosynthesis
MPRDKVRCVPSAIDVFQQPGRAEPEQRPASHAIRRAFDLPADSLVVAMAAQFIERKGHRTLVEAMPAILRAQPYARFVLFGRGPLLDDIVEAVTARGLDGYVTFAGFRSDMPALLPGVDVLAHPAYREGLGIALLEAAVAGVPIVAGRAGGIPEIVKDGQTGRLITPGDADALAKAIVELLADPDQRRHLAKQSVAHVADRFSVEAMVAGNLKVYQQLLDHQRA